MDFEEIIQRQPVINVGMIGHVANGKSSLTKSLTGISTQRFKSEKGRNVSIRLGYANCKIWRCYSCEKPKCFKGTGSDIFNLNCDWCNEKMKLINHISIVDCPGHRALTKTMLNGSCVMDYTILVESVMNDIIPAPQTKEHLMATSIGEIENKLVIMNKIDVMKKEQTISKIDEFEKYITKMRKTYEINESMIIPISATRDVNIDIVSEALSELKIPDKINKLFKMIVIRSFDINKPGSDVIELKGGVIGGTIMSGKLTVGDRIKIFPGLSVTVKKEHEETDFEIIPLSGEVVSINSDKNSLDYAISGGLLGIQLTIDPSLTRNDLLSGSMVVKEQDYKENSEIVRVFDKIVVHMKKFMMDNLDDDYEVYVNGICEKYFKKKSKLVINVNSKNVDCTIMKYSSSKKVLRLILDEPVAIDDDNNFVTIISDDKIIGRGEISGGVNCKIL